MNCTSFNKRMAELLDALPAFATDPELLRHAQECTTCARSLAEARELLADLTPSHKIYASDQFKERVMGQIRQMDTEKTERELPRRTWWPFGMVRAACAVLLLMVAVGGYNWYAGRTGKPQVTAFTVLAQAAEVMKGIKSVHIRINMKARAHDNFSHIDLNQPMIPIDIWKEYGETPRWRIEKGGRVITNDGKSTLMLIFPDSDRTMTPYATMAKKGIGFSGWLYPLLDVEQLFNHEIEQSKQDGSTVLLETEQGNDGRKKLVVTIKAPAQGDFTQSDYLRNKSIIEADNTRIYRFDQQTGRLEEMLVSILVDGKDELVFEVAGVEYDAPMDLAMFSVTPPVGAMIEDVAQSMNAGIATTSPKEVSRQFFLALSRSDMKALDQINPMFGQMLTKTPDEAQVFNRLKIISLGEPFKSGTYPGWFVPYEIQLKDGETRKHNLAVRDDMNPNHLWQVDGGF